MKSPLKLLVAGLATASITAGAVAREGDVPRGVRPLDHLFLIMMENHGYAEVIGNPDMPFLNHMAKHGALATNY